MLFYTLSFIKLKDFEFKNTRISVIFYSFPNKACTPFKYLLKLSKQVSFKN